MVMEASPSPQSVGREFVRQYYTLLNKAPSHLHRFYNNSSVFVHGGLDTASRDTSPAVGQKQIHQKIQQLNFQDCHAKINQVDSQATLGDGVVVQVSGELSNAGQPMRRFTQTFVLAAQAPKQYYVHNDIFRYQDFGYPDEEDEDMEGVEGVNESGEREGEEGGRSENEDDVQQNQAQQISATITTATEQHSQPPLITPQQATLPQQQLYYSTLPQPAVHQVIQPVTINGSVHEDTPLMSQQPPQQQQQPLPQPQQQPPQHQYISENASQEQFSQENELDSTNDQAQQVKEEAQSSNEELREQSESDTFTSSVPETEQTHSLTTSTSANNSGVKTYANLVKSFPSSTGATSPQAHKLSMSPPPMTNLRLDERSALHPQGSGPTLSSSSNVNPAQQQAHRLSAGQPSQAHQQQYQQQRPPRSGPPMQRDGERRGGRPGPFNDSHQLFLGNLPHNASESDLRQLFERYGRVAELRIHSKQNERSKGPQGSNNTTRVPNYGFITFEDHQSVTKVLQAGSLYFPEENGQKLNIEEKKPKQRGPMEGGGRPSIGDGNMRPMGQQQQQRGPGGPGGIMRGGPGARGVRAGFSRGGDGGRGGGSMRQPGNPNNSSYPNRR